MAKRAKAERRLRRNPRLNRAEVSNNNNNNNNINNNNNNNDRSATWSVSRHFVIQSLKLKMQEETRSVSYIKISKELSEK